MLDRLGGKKAMMILILSLTYRIRYSPPVGFEKYFKLRRMYEVNIRSLKESPPTG